MKTDMRNPFATEFEDSSETEWSGVSFINIILGINLVFAIIILGTIVHTDIRTAKLIALSEQTYHQTVDRLKQERCVKDSWKAKAWMDPKFWSEDEAMRWYELCLSR